MLTQTASVTAELIRKSIGGAVIPNAVRLPRDHVSMPAWRGQDLINFGESKMNRIVALVIIAGIAFAETACVSAQSQGGAATATNCDGTGVCRVDVSVNQCFVTVNPSTLPVRGKNIDIFWELDNDSYRFNETDGIRLKQDDSDFDQPQSQSGGKKFKLHDKNSKARPGESLSYSYNIKVQRLVGSRWVDCGTFDPIIINEGS